MFNTNGNIIKKTLKTESETYHLEKNGQQRRKIKRMGQMSEIDQICYKMSESRSSIAVPVHLDLDITCWSFTSFWLVKNRFTCITCREALIDWLKTYLVYYMQRRWLLALIDWLKTDLRVLHAEEVTSSPDWLVENRSTCITHRGGDF